MDVAAGDAFAVAADDDLAAFVDGDQIACGDAVHVACGAEGGALDSSIEVDCLVASDAVGADRVSYADDVALDCAAAEAGDPLVRAAAAPLAGIDGGAADHVAAESVVGTAEVVAEGVPVVVGVGVAAAVVVVADADVLAAEVMGSVVAVQVVVAVAAEVEAVVVLPVSAVVVDVVVGAV